LCIHNGAGEVLPSGKKQGTKQQSTQVLSRQHVAPDASPRECVAEIRYSVMVVTFLAQQPVVFEIMSQVHFIQYFTTAFGH